MKTHKVFFLTLCLGIFMTASSARAFEKVKETSLFNGEKLYEYKLSNGLKVLMLPRHQAQVVSYQVWFSVGSLDEKMDKKLNKTGLAHLFEHMMFRGTEKYPDGKFDELSSRLGTDKQNATTYYYRTNYFENIPVKNLEAIMELESDRMANLKLSADLIEKEKGAVVGEYRRHLDNPPSLAFEELMKLAYDEASPFHYAVIGTEDWIKGFTLEEAQYFYKTYYAPNNATIIAIGDITEKSFLPLVEKYYGEMKSQAVPEFKPEATVYPKKEKRVEKTHPQATSSLVLMGYPVPEINSDDVIALNLLGSHLSVGMESRLRKRLVDSGLAVKASAGVSNRPDLFQVFIQVAEGKKVDAVIKVIDSEMKALQTKKIDKPSLERALNQELLNLYSEIADNSSLATMLGESLMLSGNYLRNFEIIEGYKKLTAEQLQAVAKKYLNSNQRSVAIINPEAKKAVKKKGKS